MNLDIAELHGVVHIGLIPLVVGAVVAAITLWLIARPRK
jgi:hypothetical protein